MEARRHLVFWWRACRDIDSDNAAELFRSSPTKLADECGVNRSDSQLNALFNAMMEREPEWRDGARAKARADIENAQKSLKDLETR